MTGMNQLLTDDSQRKRYRSEEQIPHEKPITELSGRGIADHKQTEAHRHRKAKRTGQKKSHSKSFAHDIEATGWL